MKKSLRTITLLTMILIATLLFFIVVAWLNSLWFVIILGEIVVSSMAIFSVVVMGAALGMGRLFILKWQADLKRDRIREANEARQARIQSNRMQMHLVAEGRMMAAAIRQIENGLILPTELGEGAKFSSFPASVIKQVENEVPLLEAAKPLPAKVELTQLMTNRPSLNSLILGVSEGDEVVRDSLKSLTHIAIAGSTRWGKSIFIQMLLYQIVMAEEATKLYLADLGATSFIDFGLPYASTLLETEQMVSQVMGETEARKKLYEATGRGIKSLDMYNSVTGENLPHIIMIIDEALYLMTKSKVVKENLEIAVSWAAKYGITCLIVSQDWKSDVIGTATRNNFSSRFQFLAEDKTQSDVLIRGSGAHNIKNKGRCFSRLPGNRKIIELQTPYISEGEIMAIAPHIKGKTDKGFQDPAGLTFVVGEPKPEPEPDQADVIKLLYSEGLTKTQIAQHLGYKSNSGSIFHTIKAALGGDE